MSSRLKNLNDRLWGNVCVFLVKNVWVYTAELQTGHTEITENVSDKQKQTG